MTRRKQRITPRRNPNRKRYALYAADTRAELVAAETYFVTFASSLPDLRNHEEWSTRPAIIVDRDRSAADGRVVATNKIDQRIDR